RRKISQKPLRILQFTDVHIDPHYVANSTANCKELKRPLCCQSDLELNVEDGAGYWGDYRECDIPWYTFKNFLDFAANLHKKSPISYIYFTGDIINHRVWEGSINENIQVIKQMFAMVKRRLPGIKVFPVVGNHEAFPTNVCLEEDQSRFKYT
ncbi:hypothetical protein ILUMI_15498, partial [Ignelater luminosus]